MINRAITGNGIVYGVVCYEYVAYYGAVRFLMGCHNHLAACSAAFKINSTQVRFGRAKHVAHVNGEQSKQKMAYDYR